MTVQKFSGSSAFPQRFRDGGIKPAIILFFWFYLLCEICEDIILGKGFRFLNKINFNFSHRGFCLLRKIKCIVDLKYFWGKLRKIIKYWNGKEINHPLCLGDAATEFSLWMHAITSLGIHNVRPQCVPGAEEHWVHIRVLSVYGWKAQTASARV